MEIVSVDIQSVVASVPSTSVDNRDSLVALYGDKTDDLIRATGIERRAIAPTGVTSLDLNVDAAQSLLTISDVAPEEIGGVVNVTFTPRYRLPGDAQAAQESLGLSRNIVALDINMACSGYPHGATVAAQLAAGLQAPVVLLAGDVQSPFVSPQDKATFPLMADAGTATLIVPTPDINVWRFGHYSDGSGVESLYIPAGGGMNPLQPEHLLSQESSDGGSRRAVDIAMNGFDVFRFVAKDVAAFLSDFLDSHGVKSGDLDAFVPHQPNLYMIDQLARKLGIPSKIVWKSAHKFGNPASGSIPLTLAYAGQEVQDRQAPVSTLIAGFGAGLSVGAWLLEISPKTQFHIREYAR